MYQENQEYFRYDYDDNWQEHQRLKRITKDEEHRLKGIILDIGKASFIVKGAYPDNFNPGHLSIKLICEDCHEKHGIVYSSVNPSSQIFIDFLNSIGMSHLYNEEGKLRYQDVLDKTGYCTLRHSKDKHTGEIKKSVVDKFLKKHDSIEKSHKPDDDGWPKELKGSEPEKEFDDIPF